MKQINCLITSIVFLISCSNETPKEGKVVSIIEQKLKIESKEKEKWIYKNFADCEFNYDTISDKRYSMHLGILEKYNNKEKRGYIFSIEGDTVNKFLYHQDIAEFVHLLNPKEEGVYKILTNKVIFLILEEEPKMLDYGLTKWIDTGKELEYFMKHISNPFCNTMPIENIVNVIRSEMREPNERAIKIKKMILKNLRKNIN